MEVIELFNNGGADGWISEKEEEEEEEKWISVIQQIFKLVHLWNKTQTIESLIT